MDSFHDCKVVIMMSTYNGEKYLKEQIDSILNQSHKNFQLIIRDDGSYDNTKLILHSYDDFRIEIYEGENVGAKASFLELLKCSPESDYYAFSDQDDIWAPSKIEAAIEMLGDKVNVPCLYFSNQTIIDQEGNTIKERLDKGFKTPGIVDVLFNNDINGCTIVFNNQLMKLLRCKMFRQEAMMLRYYDAYVAEIAAIYGEILYDDRSFMRFRRHGNNSTDGRTSEEIRNSRSVMDYLKLVKESQVRDISVWAKEILNLSAEEIDFETKKMLKSIAEYDLSVKNKYMLLKNKKILKYWRGKKVAFYIKLLLGWL